MNCPDFPKQEIFFASMEKARTQDPATYLAVIAVIHTPGINDEFDWAEGHTRGDFKRAVKILRRLQKEAPQCAATYEDAITYIRTEWLHREADGSICSGAVQGNEGGAYG